MEELASSPTFSDHKNMRPRVESFSSFGSYKAVKPKPHTSFDDPFPNQDNSQSNEVDFDISFNQIDPFSISFSADDPFKSVEVNSFTNKDWFSFGEDKNNKNDQIDVLSEDLDDFSPKKSEIAPTFNNSPKQNGPSTQSRPASSEKILPEFKIRTTKDEPIPLPTFEGSSTQETLRELKLQNSMLLHQLNSVQLENKTFEKKNSLLEKDLYTWKQKFSSASSDLAKATRHASEQEQKYNKKSKQLNDLTQEYDAHSRESNQKFTKLKDEYDFLRESLNTAEELMIQLENSTEKQMINEANDLLEIRNAEIDTLHIALNDKEQYIDQLSMTLKHFERENMILKSQLDNNFDFTSFNRKIEEELHEKLSRQKIALAADSNSRFEAQAQEIEKLEFELERNERKLNAINSKYVEKTEENLRLKTELEFLNNLRSALSQQIDDKVGENELTVQHYETEMDQKGKEMNNVLLQNSKLEALLTSKDDELIQYKKQIHEYEEQMLQQTRELNYIKFELNLREAQVSDAENALEAKDNDAKLQQLVAMEDMELALKNQSVEFERLNEAQSDQIRQAEKTIEMLLAERDSEIKKRMESIELIEKRDQKIKEMKNIILELEEKLSNEDRDIEMITLKKAYKELLTIVGPKKDLQAAQSDFNADKTHRNIHSSNMNIAGAGIGPSNESVLQFYPKSTPTLDSELYGSTYVAVKGDLIDEAVEKFLRSKLKIALPTIKRVEMGIYLIAGTKLELQLIDTTLHVKTGQELITLTQYLLDYKSALFNKNMNLGRHPYDHNSNRF